jgi:hypothetical protein
MRPIRFCYLSWFTVVSLSIAVSVAILGCESPYSSIATKLKDVRPGMSKSQVTDIMQVAPTNVQDLELGGQRFEVWFYDHSPLASEPPRCTFDSTGTVVYVVADDSYASGQWPPRGLRNTTPSARSR